MGFFDWVFSRAQKDIERVLEVRGELREHEQVPQPSYRSGSPYGDSTKLHEDIARLVTGANFPENRAFYGRIGVEYFERCEALRILPAHDAIVTQMIGAATGLYAGERYIMENIPNPALYQGTVAAGQFRDMLLAQQAKLIHPEATLTAMKQALVECFVVITRRLPWDPLESTCRHASLSIL